MRARNNAATEIAMGNIITVVALLLIHMLTKAVATMNPANTRLTRDPVCPTIQNATRSCSRHRCKPRASTKPPRKR